MKPEYSSFEPAKTLDDIIEFWDDHNAALNKQTFLELYGNGKPTIDEQTELIMMTFMNDKGLSYYKGTGEEESTHTIIKKLCKVLLFTNEHKDTPQCGQNLKYQSSALLRGDSLYYMGGGMQRLVAKTIKDHTKERVG
eukprot:7879033-Ditylum_brightwellii.AAC.1